MCVHTCTTCTTCTIKTIINVNYFLVLHSLYMCVATCMVHHVLYHPSSFTCTHNIYMYVMYAYYIYICIYMYVCRLLW